ncbi:TIGR03668 family PPOX class F420-dependent oxidoreductase [Mycobacterium branderi]|uniref:PPOX class F420-dependent oxidoreductase n=1 Tax=Mycobacterium branderi TaxID=43348 RepID=A0AA91RFV2_9MYCO|nr:TIGR03668 family PPOX class F420-dependent oxidoreductase [Mycobacterium branderi]MCV7232014.1 TIGR03668 family PPOX class F420-dependent oxidoreductase [Mycobacterium branderi]ORA32434.1 PPOX class F420-dependent oxidoreductase [Mycobacterium branderi]
MVDFDPKTSFASASVARLATVAPDGTPHLVPVVFALRLSRDDVVYTAVDAKPKSTRRLRRLANIEHNPRVSVLVDHYADDWAQLWWVRADGIARIHRTGNALQAGYDLLRAKYPQYQSVPLDGPVIAVAVRRWSSWHA